ncbi:hypothetical protein JOC76_000867 [Neobacillus cucumis]|nr:hypothetical protein [Neobacillus cucumis]
MIFFKNEVKRIAVQILPIGTKGIINLKRATIRKEAGTKPLLEPKKPVKFYEQ